MHRQHDGRSQSFQNADHCRQIHGHAAVDSRHHNVEPPECRVLLRVRFMVQVTQMANAQTRNLEYENRVAVFFDIIEEPAANIGGDVPNKHLSQVEVMVRGFASVAPSFQDMRDRRSGIAVQ